MLFHSNSYNNNVGSNKSASANSNNNKTKRDDAVAAVAVLLSPPSSGYCDNNDYDNDTCTDTTRRTSLRLLTTPSCAAKTGAKLNIIENIPTTQILLLLPKLDTIRIIKFVIYGS